MDLNIFSESFKNMNYDLKNKLKLKLSGIASTIIITESADLETASDFIVALLESDDEKLLNTIIVQEPVSKLFTEMLNKKAKISLLNDEIEKFSKKGFEVVGNRIVKCTRSMIEDNSSAVSLEVFRTTKEGISLAKPATSVGLWCEKLSIAFEYISTLNAQQIWLNSSFGSVNPKVPFLSHNNDIICEDELKNSIKSGSQISPLVETSGNTQFLTTFQNGGKFKTIVIPFGETFAN